MEENEKNPLLTKEVINAFIKGVTKTLETMANTKAEPMPPRVEKKFQSKGDVAGMIGLVAGEMKGTLTISFRKESLFKILKNMLDEDFTELNEEAADAAGELTNIIYGDAKATLNRLGYKFEMAIPTIITGQFVITNHHNSAATLVVPFQYEGTEFFVELTVQT